MSSPSLRVAPTIDFHHSQFAAVAGRSLEMIQQAVSRLLCKSRLQQQHKQDHVPSYGTRIWLNDTACTVDYMPRIKAYHRSLVLVRPISMYETPKFEERGEI